MGAKNILIGGGTGNIGKYLTRRLIADGHNVSLISRKNASLNNWASSMLDNRKFDFKLPELIEWKSIEKEGLPLETDVVINLAGKSIGNIGPWLPSLKDEITNSRIKSTKVLAQAIAKSQNPPNVFISASAVGIYECNPEVEYNESDIPVREGRENFFTNLCKKWEEAADIQRKDQDDLISTHDTRIVHPRFGVVLAHDTPPMNLMLISSLAGGSAVLGSGTQPFPWIHIEDVVSILLTIIENDKVSGPINVVAPQIVSNKEFSQALSDACFKKPILPGLPASAVQLLYGKERADNILLNSPQVVPGKLLELNFDFKFPNVDSAMVSLIDTQSASSSVLGKILNINKSMFKSKG